jgi:hypothetical protein
MTKVYYWTFPILFLIHESINMFICSLHVIQCLEPQYTHWDISIKVFFCLTWSNPMGIHWVAGTQWGTNACVSFMPTNVCGYRFSSESRVLWSADFCSIHLEPAPIAIPSVNVSSLDICNKGRKKHDDARSISRMNTMVLDWFRPSRGVIDLRPVFVVLCYEILCPW